jgi:prolyl oligopeptidase
MCASVPALAATEPAPAADPYIWLEQVSSPESLAWIDNENKRSLAVLETDPRFETLYSDALKIAEATDRIPTPNQTGGGILNFWQDADHVHGIWRMATPASYLTANPHWHTLIDLDALSATE